MLMVMEYMIDEEMTSRYTKLHLAISSRPLSYTTHSWNADVNALFAFISHDKTSSSSSRAH